MPPTGDPIHGPSNRPFASVGARFGALVIDYLVVWLVCGALGVLLFVLTVLARPDVQEPSDTFFNLLVSLMFLGWGVALFLYHWLCLMISGRSLGKLLTRTQVVSEDGGPLTQPQAIMRSAIFGLPHTIPCIGHLFVLGECLTATGNDTQRRALHDRAARTVVVRV